MLNALRTFFGTKVDNSPLILFRMCFGFLAAAECYGAILTGWVKKTLIDPNFTFTVIGFEWLQPLPGDGMIYYFLLMGTAGVLIMLGLFYRASTFTFLVMWTGVYMMQKSHYNNHYYLLVLLSAVMLMLPAHKQKSLDVKWGITQVSNTCPRICHWFFILQIVIVYVYASIHKMNPDWINLQPIGKWLSNKSDYWLIGPLLAKEWFQYVIAWGGIIYDGSIAFLLLNKRTRKLGFVLSIVFNLFNSAVFQIGIFPYLMIALSAFFFPPETIRKLFFKQKEPVQEQQQILPMSWSLLLVIYFTFQLLLPLRHHLYEGHVGFTEEGHRLAWRMMLRAKSGSVKFRVVDKASGEEERIRLKDHLSRDQRGAMAGQPDMIWTFAQRLKQHYAEKGQEVQVFANARISLNSHPRNLLIDPGVDLASMPWEPWKHSDWILTKYKEEE